jgi:hypothetical protein
VLTDSFNKILAVLRCSLPCEANISFKMMKLPVFRLRLIRFEIWKLFMKNCIVIVGLGIDLDRT